MPQVWFDDRTMARLAVQVREAALLVTSGNPGRAITFNEFASSLIILGVARRNENMTRLKLRILDRYIALGHTLTDEERVEIEAEKAVWEEKRRKARRELEQVYIAIGATSYLRKSEECWDSLLAQIYGL